MIYTGEFFRLPRWLVFSMIGETGRIYRRRREYKVCPNCGYVTHGDWEKKSERRRLERRRPASWERRRKRDRRKHH